MRTNNLILTVAAAVLSLSGCIHVELQDGSSFRQNSKDAPIDWLVRAREKLTNSASLEQVTFKGGGGAALGGMFLRKPGAEVTIVYFQDDGSTVAKSYPWLLKQSLDMKANAMFWDYRGTGLSASSGAATDVLTDSRAAATEAIRLSGKQLAVVYWGYGFGTTAAADLAHVSPPDGMILEGVATGAEKWALASDSWYAKVYLDGTRSAATLPSDRPQSVQPIQYPTLFLVGELELSEPPLFARPVALQARSRRCVSVIEVPGIGRQPTAASPAGHGAAVKLLEKAATQPGS